MPFKEINEAAARHAEALCKRWLPAGKRHGGWWVASTPWREDRNPSLGVSVRTGKWRDFANGERGDFIDLYQKLYGGTSVDAARAVARVVGHEFGSER